MRSLRALCLALGVLAGVALAGSARAEGDTAESLAGEIASLERGRAVVLAERARLDAEDEKDVGEIERLKAESANVARDYRLGQLLAASQELARKEDALAADLGARDAYLAARRRQLVEACAREQAAPGVSEARRAELARLRATALAGLASSSSSSAASGGGEAGPLRIAGAGALDPLAGPSELAERADRVKDDEDKLRREETKLAERIRALEESRRVRERAADVDDDLFGEWTLGRRAVRAAPATTSNTTSAAVPAADAAGGTKSNVQTPAANVGAAPGQSPNPTVGGSNNGPQGGGAGGAANFTSSPPATPSTVLRGLVDPATLSQLQEAEGGGDPEGELRALKKARGDVAKLAAQLARHEAELRRRAADLTRSERPARPSP